MLLVVPATLYALWSFYQDVETLTGDSAVKNSVLGFVFVGHCVAIRSLNGQGV